MTDFTYQEGTPLTWAQMNENLRLMQAKYLDASNSAAIAIAAANFKGNWSSLTGPLAVPASVYHSGEFWILLTNIASVAANTPGVSASWAIAGNVRKTGDTMTGPLAQAAGSAALPSYTFSGDTNTGMWSPGADILAWSTAGAERIRIDTSGNVLVTGSGGLGYGAGSGGTVTQGSSVGKGTTVTLNKPSGKITMDGATLAAGGVVTFLFNNSLLTQNDQLLFSLDSSGATAGAYLISATIGGGGANVSVRNLSGVALSEAIVINFAVIKVATS